MDALQFELGGELSVHLIDLGSGTFSPTAGQFFDLMIGNSFTGDFSSFNLASLGEGLFWTHELFNLGSGEVAYCLEVTSEVPEPRTFLLVALGLFWIALRRRRIRTTYDPTKRSQNITVQRVFS